LDCHDSSVFDKSLDFHNDELNSPSLAEGDKGGGYQHAINSNKTKSMIANSTHPLTPSAREGEQKENSHNDKMACHTERSEVSQNQNRNILFSTKSQYDKVAVIASKQSERGNLQCNKDKKYTHPLTPSAREGEFLDSNFTNDGGQESGNSAREGFSFDSL
ncbi:hypothetical protein, partial [Helicobacter sp. T3_23-1059]